MVVQEHKRAVEIQGGIRNDVLRSEYDAERLAFPESQGIRVLLFENRKLLEIPDCVVGVIRSAVLGQPPRLRQ